MARVATWTDEQLVVAVRNSTTIRSVVRALGLRSGSQRHVAERVHALGLDTSHFRQSQLPWTDEELRRIVPRCTTCTQVLEAIGAPLHSNSFSRLRRRLTLLGIDTSHFVRERKVDPSGKVMRRRWSDDDLREAIAGSRSLAQVVRRLGLIPAGGNYDQVQRRIRELELDTSRLRGKGWNVGLSFQPSLPRPLTELLVRGSTIGSHLLKQRLFREGLREARCELCGWCERSEDGRIPVELDHINGDHADNRLENLRILCPNCHSLQPTHRGRNQRRARERRTPR